MNAITKTESGALALRDDELIAVLQSSLYPGASPASIKLVLGYCRAAGFDPMQKPVHIVPMWDSKAGAMRDVVMPGVGLYRTQAARGGCAGVSEPEFGPDVTETIGGMEITFPLWCRVTVKRRQAGGEVDEFTAREFWRENYAVRGGKEKSVAPNAMWTKRPYGQLAKCAEAQALRKAFPEIGSAPAAEEMEGKALDAEYIDGDTGEVRKATPPAPPAPPPTWPTDSFDAQMKRWTKAVESGVRTVTDILAVARSKGALTAEQEAAILALKKAPPPDDDPFVADMDAAEAAGVRA
jgi:phage recombination protein Bet